ncbi:excinuclease ABC subunit UvrC [Luteibaculum oceani]|uniref:UvrABC system protein C n=1 Tax=Luteibaculum oceani TaxID=1294296 RepID=A0A5C6VLL3_9FLAO|nr:excinuclease ABC subunit UvrC [Luteibaculum oceani]TXC85346.1 excinuclease ABC subunit UvrC [Luteibaculum oceani]
MALLKEKIKTLPHKPGVYQFFNLEGKIIYVGKAKNLKKRVSSYFSKTHQYGKVVRLVKQAVDVQVVVVDTEMDALLLENNLIKKYQPKYNVMLKDDKSYPWICIKNERFPRVFSTRNPIKDGSQYFGPYASVRSMKTVLEIIREIFKVRTCNYNLSEENIDKGKFRVCLEYHIGNCFGPCEGKQSEEEYNENLSEIISLTKGNLSQVTKDIKTRIQKHAEKLEFEIAASLKEKLDRLEKYQAKSTVVSPTINNIDVFSIVSDKNTGYINFFKIMSGAIVQSFTLEINKRLDETDAELLELGIVELREKFNSQSREIVVPFEIDFKDPNLSFTIPQRGDKKKLLELSQKNAKFYMMDKHKQEKIIHPEKHAERILKQLKDDLSLKVLPRHIECFDNSNLQGTNPVAACVVFKNAKPAKRDYRHFNIKSVEGPNDFASMEEAVYRRYTRLLSEGEDLPQLVVIDGGKGQLSSAVTALERLGLRGKIAIIGIAKRLEEIYFPGDSIPVYIDKKSESLKVIQFLRNEAHRFGITHHRNRRSKAALQNQLTDIPGIGLATAKKLYNQFGSVSGIKKASLEELEKQLPKNRAKVIYDWFKNEK